MQFVQSVKRGTQSELCKTLQKTNEVIKLNEVIELNEVIVMHLYKIKVLFMRV